MSLLATLAFASYALCGLAYARFGLRKGLEISGASLEDAEWERLVLVAALLAVGALIWPAFIAYGLVKWYRRRLEERAAQLMDPRAVVGALLALRALGRRFRDLEGSGAYIDEIRREADDIIAQARKQYIFIADELLPGAW